jgi:methanethiol S-methyltransferase
MTGHIAHSGASGLALIIIVIASWLLYRYLAPKTWKEWASAGALPTTVSVHYCRHQTGR